MHVEVAVLVDGYDSLVRLQCIYVVANQIMSEVVLGYDETAKRVTYIIHLQ